MHTYSIQPSENDGDLILAASQATPTSGLAADYQQPPAPKGPEGPEWLLSTKEAAKFLGLSPHTLSKWRITGRGPPFQALGRRCLYDPETLRRWAASRARRSTSDPGVEAES